jgi:hypothetical protein
MVSSLKDLPLVICHGHSESETRRFTPSFVILLKFSLTASHASVGGW